MTIPGYLNYDIDGVINKCGGKTIQNELDYLVNDINRLVDNLYVCEESFHSKGTSNKIYVIYNNFSYIFGDRTTNGSIKTLLKQTVDILNNDYLTARSDKIELERIIEEERRREEEERRRREEEERNNQS